MKLSFRTYQQQSPGYTSLALAIAYTDGVVDEKQISRAIQLGIDSVIHSISQSVASNAGSRRVDGQQRVAQECAERNQMDKILEQILCEGVDVSTVLAQARLVLNKGDSNGKTESRYQCQGSKSQSNQGS